MLELYKGKLTTNPSCHSGEGILLFHSKNVNMNLQYYQIIRFFHFCSDGKKKILISVTFEFSYYTKLKKVGTMVVMRLENDTITTSKDVFDSFAPLEEGFIKTLIPMREVCPLGNPVARSQARRVSERDLMNFKKSFSTSMELNLWDRDLRMRFSECFKTHIRILYYVRLMQMKRSGNDPACDPCLVVYSKKAGKRAVEWKK